MIHKHIAKHAKRAHAHVQDHGHKWMRLLSAVFFFILVYPYFSNAQEGADVCQNIEGIQEVPPENFVVDGENCVCAEGFELDEEDNCVAEVEDDGVGVDGDDEITALTGTITYDPATSTTGPVTTTLSGFSTTGVTITNNSGINTKVFTENGSFEFIFENADGVTGSALATVDWIDNVIIAQECEIQMQAPTSGDLVSGIFDIDWSIDACDDNEIIVQLRDHNSKWIDIGTGDLEDEIFAFDSAWLVSTGFYTITGVHLSGTTYSGVTYTQDTIYNIYTGAYIGSYTNYATGYKVRLLDVLTQDILVTNDGTFTIDNQKPTITTLTGSFAPVLSWYVGGWYVGKAGIMTASFAASEQLTGGTTFTILGTTVTPTTGSQSGNIYTYTVPLTSIVASGALVFTANVTDLAGNTGTAYGTSSIILNNSIPNISGFTFTTGTASGSINLSWKTNISTRYNLSFSKSGTVDTTYFTGTTYGTSHTYTMTNIQNGHQYPFVLTALNNVDNNSILQGTLHKSTTGALSISLQSSNDILQLSGQAETNLYLQILQNEINKFQSCKAAITFTNQTIPVGNKSIVIKIPTITSNSVKQTMLTFLLLFTNKVQEKTTLSQAELNIVADAVNNFLVVIKLVDDDNNNCEQKMSTYYLSQFEQLMSSMSFF